MSITVIPEKGWRGALVEAVFRPAGSEVAAGERVASLAHPDGRKAVMLSPQAGHITWIPECGMRCDGFLLACADARSQKARTLSAPSKATYPLTVLTAPGTGDRLEAGAEMFRLQSAGRQTLRLKAPSRGKVVRVYVCEGDVLERAGALLEWQAEPDTPTLFAAIQPLNDQPDTDCAEANPKPVRTQAQPNRATRTPQPTQSRRTMRATVRTAPDPMSKAPAKATSQTTQEPAQPNRTQIEASAIPKQRPGRYVLASLPLAMASAGALWHFEMMPESVEARLTEVVESVRTIGAPPPPPRRPTRELPDLETLGNGTRYTPTSSQVRELMEYLQ